VSLKAPVRRRFFHARRMVGEYGLRLCENGLRLPHLKAQRSSIFVGVG
jgi:hypothetical protein